MFPPLRVVRTYQIVLISHIEVTGRPCGCYERGNRWEHGCYWWEHDVCCHVISPSSTNYRPNHLYSLARSFCFVWVVVDPSAASRCECVRSASVSYLPLGGNRVSHKQARGGCFQPDYQRGCVCWLPSMIETTFCAVGECRSWFLWTSFVC